MHGKVKLSKRQIKEDKFATFMLTSRGRIEENWQYYAIGAAAVILVIAAAIFFVRSHQSAQIEQADKLAQAEMQARSGNTQVALMSLNQLVEDASGTVAKNALFTLARVQYESKNYPEAIRLFEQFASKYESDKLQRAAALAYEAAAMENQGQSADAAAKYQQAIDAYPDGPMVDQYRLSAMRNYLAAGNVAKAKDYLAQIKSKNAMSETALQATRMLAEKDPAAASGS